MHNKKQKHLAFTLIELMIVVAIIGVLAAIAYPSFAEQIRKTRRVDAMNVLTQCAAQQERAYTIDNSYNLDDLCGFVNDGTYYSEDGYYTIAVTNPGDAGCVTNVGGVDRNNCFTATVTVVSAGSQVHDLSCQSFSINHLGVKTASDSAPVDSTATCWRD